MPKYELLYIIGSETADDAVPQVTEEVRKAIADGSGTVEKHEEWGRRKLAYPIKKTKNGFYVLDNFEAPSEQIEGIEHKIRTNLNIIRHLIVNMDDSLRRMEKDKVVQSQMKPRRPQEVKIEDTKASSVRKSVRRSASETGAEPAKKIEIDLDAEIEKAIGSEDVK